MNSQRKVGSKSSRGKHSIVIVLSLPESGQLIPLFHVNLDSKLTFGHRPVARQLSSAGFDDTLAKYYEEQMRRVLHMPKDRVEFGCHISKVDVEKFKSTVKELIRKVRLHENK